MATPLIQVDSLSKGFSGDVLFDDATFHIMPGDKVAIVGPNGAGKSTLLQILAGRLRADHGQLRIQDVRSHWFDQHPEVPAGATVADLLSTPKPVPPALQAEKDALESRIADPGLYEQPGYEAVLEQYAAIEQQIKRATAAGDVDSAILDQLGALDLHQDATSLSGGERTRVFLAKTLDAARAGDLVVLDEPTNHLDVDSIEWLEDWINGFDGTVLMVAHDRAFLDNVATRVLEIKGGRVTLYEGNYEDYVAARDEDDERLRRDKARAEEKLAGAKATIQQFRHQKRFDGQYASRMKAVEKYQAALEQAPDPVMEKLGFGLAFGAVDKSSHEMLHATGLSKAYKEPVLDAADVEIRRDDRIGLVGANGAGKSTLIRILTGQEQADDGKIRVAPGVKGAFFSQEHDDLQAERTLHDEVLDARPLLEEPDVKALLGRFRFRPELDIGRKVRTLSGGERQRLKLLKCVLKPSNLLILDEPTNHLDLWAKDVVIDALRSYHGTMVVVSHDRFLLDAVTKTTMVVDEGQVHEYAGTFTQTRDQHRRKASIKAPTRYVVRKKFDDWTKNRRYRRDDEVELSDSELTASMTLRNALAQGWLERL